MSKELDMNFEFALNDEIRKALDLMSKRSIHMRFAQMNGNFQEAAKQYDEEAREQVKYVEQLYEKHYNVHKPFKVILKEYLTALEELEDNKKDELEETQNIKR